MYQPNEMVDYEDPYAVGQYPTGLQTPAQRPTPTPFTEGKYSAAGLAGTAAKVASPWLGLGLGAVSAVGNWLGGGYARGVRKEGMNRLRSMYDKPVFDVGAMTAYRRKATLADTQRFGNQMDRRFGLDTGRGFGEFSRGLLSQIDQGAADAYYQEAMARARRNLEIAQTQAGYR